MARDEDNIGVGLADSCRDRPNTHFGNKFHVNPGTVIRILQIMDQLRQILDRVDVVVRWRGDQAHSGSGISGLGDPWIYLVSR